MADRRVDADALKGFAQAIMRAGGVDEEQIRSVSGNLIWSDLVGRPNFGVLRLPILMERVNRGLLRCPCHPRFEPLSATVECLDGDGGFGQHVAEIGMLRAIELAGAGGVGVVGIRNSNFFGTGAYFVQIAAEAGMIALAMSNSFPKVVAHGGIRPVFGTNPFAFGAPRRTGRSLLVDMATSALAGSTVREHQRTGTPLPEGLAIDGEGRPVTDPARLADGALLPFGGPKGAALALIVEVLSGVITGAGVGHGVASMYSDFTRSGDNGHFLLALDIARWMPLQDYFERLESLVMTLKASAADGKVRLPGEIRWRNYHDNLSNGVRVDGKVREQLEALARPHAIPVPW
jgi:ureidoglycolate dehydrogenase (NAD+)